MTTQSEQALQDAIRAWQRKDYPSIRATARAYNVSRVTLGRRVNGGNTRQQARESQQTLSRIQEDLLIQWILSMESAGAPPTFAQVREFAGHISQASGGLSTIGINWTRRFLKRNPTIRSKVGKAINYLRVETPTRDALQTFFELFASTIKRLQVRSRNIWNFDETGVAMGICSNQIVLGTSSTRRSYSKSPQNREWATILEACSAAGKTIDPVILFKGQAL